MNPDKNIYYLYLKIHLVKQSVSIIYPRRAKIVTVMIKPLPSIDGGTQLFSRRASSCWANVRRLVEALIVPPVHRRRLYRITRSQLHAIEGALTPNFIDDDGGQS